jgi:hypothetical protein
MNRLRRSFAAWALALGLALAPASALAQNRPQRTDPNAAPVVETVEESKGDPMYGYVGTAFLCSFVLFAVCKSARR